jgi:hypothetical protein
MNRIKLFENFKTEDYYRKIDDESEFNNLLGDDWKNEIKFSKKLERQLNELGFDTNRVPQTGDYRFKYKSLFIPLYNRDVRIYQLVDEYFILEIQPRWPKIAYLCDQFEGLVKCLEDMWEGLLKYYAPKERKKKVIRESYTQSDYYQKTDGYDLPNPVDISQETESKLRELFKGNDSVTISIDQFPIDEDPYNVRRYGVDTRNEFRGIQLQKKYSDKYTDIFICEYPDEWFSCEIVRTYTGLSAGVRPWTQSEIGLIPSQFYKCDQWDGLVKLLKDKGIL